MTAKEMFEELGYEKVSDIPICYRFDDGGYVNLIEFIDTKQEIMFTEYEEYNDNQPQGSFLLNMEELEAINKQIEELGWLEGDNICNQ